MRTEIAHSLKYYRGQRQLSQRDLAAICGLAQSTICRWETQQRNPSLVEVATVCMALGVTPNDLLGVKSTTGQWMDDLDAMVGPGTGKRVYDAMVRRIAINDLIAYLQDEAVADQETPTQGRLGHNVPAAAGPAT